VTEPPGAGEPPDSAADNDGIDLTSCHEVLNLASPVGSVDDLKDRAAALTRLAGNGVLSDAALEMVHLLGKAISPQVIECRERPASCVRRLLRRVPVTHVAECRERRTGHLVGVGDTAGRQ